MVIQTSNPQVPDDVDEDELSAVEEVPGDNIIQKFKLKNRTLNDVYNDIQSSE